MCCSLIAAVIAMIWANSPWSSSYEDVWRTPITISIGDHSLHLISRQWINEGLLTIFFFVVGLEIKRELVRGQLSSRRAALLPVAAAVGGMVAPALIYLAIAGDAAPRGWAIVVATDIPLALGVLAIAGDRVHPTMRVFLLALAIVDDIGSLLIIAAVYSAGIGWGWLIAAMGVFVTAVLARRLGVRRHWVYIALGCLLWIMLHQAGLNATLAGVAMGLSRHRRRGLRLSSSTASAASQQHQPRRPTSRIRLGGRVARARAASMGQLHHHPAVRLGQQRESHSATISCMPRCDHRSRGRSSLVACSASHWESCWRRSRSSPRGSAIVRTKQPLTNYLVSLPRPAWASRLPSSSPSSRSPTRRNRPMPSSASLRRPSSRPDHR